MTSKQTKTAVCSDCKKMYEEEDEECFKFIEAEVPMICYECQRKHHKNFEKRMNKTRANNE